MRCMVCHSYTIIKFIDGYGGRRIFCKHCQFNPLENERVNLPDQKKLKEFLQGGFKWR